LRIGIDLMGSDSSSSEIFDAVIQALDKLDPSLRLIAFATQPVVAELNPKAKSLLSPDKLARLSFFPVADFIAMNEDPLAALRQKKGSSIAMGIRLLKKKQLDAFVSAGNTGALIASATIALPKFPGITRPALLAVLPTKTGSVALVDVGGSVSCKAPHLLKYAYMGAAYQKCTAGIKVPRVGLLNIGAESRKGTSVVRQAYQLLTEACRPPADPSEEPYMEFHGNIEGRDVFHGKVDVLVTDGFTGNVLVKTSEGIADVIFDFLNEALHQHPSPSLEKTLNSIQSLFHYAEYQGALLCGIEGIVIKCHGHSNAKAFFNGIKGATNMIRHKLLQQIKEHLQ
jgi:phosphate acyltransferase